MIVVVTELFGVVTAVRRAQVGIMAITVMAIMGDLTEAMEVVLMAVAAMAGIELISARPEIILRG